MTPAQTAQAGHVYTLGGERNVIAMQSGYVVEVRVLDADGEIDHMIPPIVVKASWICDVDNAAADPR